jgi:hypothetical protein
MDVADAVHDKPFVGCVRRGLEQDPAAYAAFGSSVPCGILPELAPHIPITDMHSAKPDKTP